MISASQPTTFALGKFAGDAEYVRVDGGGAVAALDEWVSQATALGYAKRGDSWRMSLPMGAPFAFLWHPRRDRENDELLAGVIAPSRDAVGRDYPLVIVTRFSEKLVANAPHLVPLAFGEFLDVSYETIADARAKPMPVPAFAARVGAIVCPTELDVSNAGAQYDAWCAEVSVSDGWRVVFGDEDPVESAVQAIATLTSTLGPTLATGAALTARLPLGTGGAAAAVLWLDVVARLFRGLKVSPSAFWGTDDAALVVGFGAMPPGLLVDLWSASAGGSPGAEETFDVVRAMRDAPPRSRAIVEPPSSGSTMKSWLEGLRR